MSDKVDPHVLKKAAGVIEEKALATAAVLRNAAKEIEWMQGGLKDHRRTIGVLREDLAIAELDCIAAGIERDKLSAQLSRTFCAYCEEIVDDTDRATHWKICEKSPSRAELDRLREPLLALAEAMMIDTPSPTETGARKRAEYQDAMVRIKYLAKRLFAETIGGGHCGI